MEIRTAFDQLLPTDHPSFGTSRAVFLFAIGPSRILAVEAKNPWAVLCLERLLLVDGKASDKCRAIQVIRDYRDVGTRDEMVEEVPFVDFMLDIADMDRLMGGGNDDALILAAFKNALSQQEVGTAVSKLHALRQLPADPFEGYVPVVDQTESVPSDQTERLTTALVGLGFKKPSVRGFVASLGEKIHKESLDSLIRQGLKALAA